MVWPMAPFDQVMVVMGALPGAATTVRLPSVLFSQATVSFSRLRMMGGKGLPTRKEAVSVQLFASVTVRA